MSPAPKGNEFWKLRSSHGRSPTFETPEDLWDAACQYFEWVENNPLYEDKGYAWQGIITHEPIAKMRAMTLSGLHLFIDISNATWINYKEKEDFLTVTTRIDRVIRAQKFAGAAAELLNPNIIARDLGLVDKTDITSKGEKVTPVNVTVLDNEQGDKLAAIASKVNASD